MPGRPFAATFGLLVAVMSWIVGTCPASAAELECLLAPRRVVEVSFPTPGIVAEVAVDRGDTVKAGALLARLDTRLEEATLRIARARLTESAALDAARAQLEIVDRQLARTRELALRQVATEVRVEQIEAERQGILRTVREQEEIKRVQNLELDRAQTVMELRGLRSPIDGVVVERLIQPGEHVDTRKAIVLAEIDPLAVEVIAPAALFGRFGPGDEVKVRLAPPQAGETRARVDVVDAYVDAASGTFRVRLSLPNPERRLTAGFGCHLSLEN
ncbi:MAG: efflux RND transporter periplasmic adaptor subunit [Siculibacillus sp.]|nr:efflux RND transporter periplasmic adaptor subunit [Siculibacillus sp.]